MRTIGGAEPNTDRTPDSSQGGADPEASLLDGLDRWLHDFILDMRRETETLAANGVTEAVVARTRMIDCLLRAARAWLGEEIEVAEAARLAGCCEETIRRKVRQGKVLAQRTGERGHIRLPRAAARALAPSSRAAYDASADARGIAKLSRRLG